MSAGAPEVVVRANDAFQRGDHRAFAECCTEDVLVEPLLGGVEGAYRGRDGMRRWLADRDREWLEIEALFGEFRPAGPDTWIADGHVRAVGRHSEVPVEQPVSGGLVVRDGLIARLLVDRSEDAVLRRLRDPG